MRISPILFEKTAPTIPPSRLENGRCSGQHIGENHHHARNKSDQSEDRRGVADGEGSRMTGHADDAFRRQDHGGRTDSIIRGVTMAAGCILIPDRHLVDSGDLARLELSFPYHMLRLGISFRLGSLEMTAPAGHQAMQIMSNLLVMISEMALPAVAVNVLAVAGLRCHADGRSRRRPLREASSQTLQGQ